VTRRPHDAAVASQTVWTQTSQTFMLGMTVVVMMAMPIMGLLTRKG
jgi:cytochrome b561